MGDTEPLERGGESRSIPGERKARRMDAERRQPRLAVAPVPSDRVRERADAVELGEVEEVHEDGTGRGELGEHRRRSAPIQRSRGGSTGAAMLSASGRKGADRRHERR